MIVDSLAIDPVALAADTGWEAKPQGLCKGPECVLLPDEARLSDGLLDLAVVAERLRMPLVHDETAGVWALGPQGGGQALDSATAAELTLPDADGNPFSLSSLHGRKVLLVAWASW